MKGKLEVDFIRGRKRAYLAANRVSESDDVSGMEFADADFTGSQHLMCTTERWIDRISWLFLYNRQATH